jgi:hypothetical protein
MTYLLVVIVKANTEHFCFVFCFNSVGLCYPLRIPDPRLPRGYHVDKTPSRNVPYDYDNEVDKENYCPYPQEVS